MNIYLIKLQINFYIAMTRGWLFHCTNLGQVAGKLCFTEPLLNLMVYELDEGVVLLAQLLVQDPVVFFTHLVSPLLAHTLTDKSHLPESKDGFVSLSGGYGRKSAVLDSRGDGGPHGRGVVHHRLGTAWRRMRTAVVVLAMLMGVVGRSDLASLAQSLEFVPQVVGDFCGRQRRLSEDEGIV